MNIAMKAFAVMLLSAGATASLADCSFDIEVGDGLSYSMSAVEVSADCEEVTINLAHTGSLPAAAMGHNWVLTEAADMRDVATAGMASGIAGNYLPAGDDRVLAATSIIGGGENTSVTFSLAGLDAGKEYKYFCSFPGHWSVMQGPFKIL